MSDGNELRPGLLYDKEVEELDVILHVNQQTNPMRRAKEDGEQKKSVKKPALEKGLEPDIPSDTSEMLENDFSGPHENKFLSGYVTDENTGCYGFATKEEEAKVMTVSAE